MQDDNGSDQDRLRARLAELAPDPESYEALTDELALFAGAGSEKLYQMQSDIGHSLDEALSDVMLLQQRESLSVEVSTLLERFAVPSFLVRADGRIVSRNESAMQVFETPDNATVIDLPFDLQQAEPLEEMVARVAHLRGGNQPLHLRRGFLHESDRMITLVLLPTQVGADLAPGLLMFVIDPVMHDQAIDLLAQAHGLTDAEKDILKAFGDGKPMTDIAQDRGRSLSTIRTQFQRLLEKTGAGSQAELMRSTQALSNFVHDLGDVVDVASHPTRSRLDVLRPEGRSVDVLISGDRTGTPVVFVTGAFLYSFPPVIEAAFRDAGICVLAICRPGFGRTSGVPEGQDRVTCISQDTQAVLSQLGVSSAPFLVHSSGIPAALDMAHVLGEVMQRIVIIGGMAPMHHMRAHAAKSTSMAMSILAVAGTSRRLLRLLLSGRHRLFMRLGPRRFLKRLYAKSPEDQNLAIRPDLEKEYETAASVLMAQGYDVGILELLDAQRDWGANLSALTMPITVLHGREDPLCPVEAMQAWAAENPDQMTLKVLEGVGHYSLAARPDEVIALLQSGTD